MSLVHNLVEGPRRRLPSKRPLNPSLVNRKIGKSDFWNTVTVQTSVKNEPDRVNNNWRNELNQESEEEKTTMENVDTKEKRLDRRPYNLGVFKGQVSALIIGHGGLLKLIAGDERLVRKVPRRRTRAGIHKTDQRRDRCVPLKTNTDGGKEPQTNPRIDITERERENNKNLMFTWKI